VSVHDERFTVIQAGFRGDAGTARDALGHDDPKIRASALRALQRMSALVDGDLAPALLDASPEVRRTAVELASTFPEVPVHGHVNDADVFVAEMTAWCMGERTGTDEEIASLIDAAMNHPEAVVREASVAALGSLGDERGLPAILLGCNDKPAVRRRAVLALAPFEGPDVEAALAAALEDRDWQVRQNAEILMSPRGS
jgi:HEAT repeat protein